MRSRLGSQARPKVGLGAGPWSDVVKKTGFKVKIGQNRTKLLCPLNLTLWGFDTCEPTI